MNEIFKFWDENIYINDGLLWGTSPSSVAKKTVKILKQNNLFKNENKITMLDIGCGYGRDCNYFQNKGMHVTGIDFSHRAISLAKEINPNVTYLAKDILKGLPFENNSFHIVYTNGVLQWMSYDEINFVIKEILRIVAANGYVIISIPTFNIPKGNSKHSIIFAYNDFVLHKNDINELLIDLEIINELVVKEFHSHGIKHKHEYYVVIAKNLS